MNQRVRIAGAVGVAVVVLVSLASTASGSAGDPLVLGTSNYSLSDTFLRADGDANGIEVTSTENALQGTSTSEGAGVAGIGSGGGTGVDAVGINGADALTVEGYAGLGGKVRFSGGPIVYDNTSGLAVVPAGSDRVTVSVPNIAFDRQSHATATLQQRRSAIVQAVRPNRAGHTLTIFLDKPVGLDTKVAWFLFD